MEYVEITNQKITYLKYSTCKKDQVLIDGGIFTGTTENQFGSLNFNFTKDGELLVLPSCGALKFNLKEKKLVEGATYKIVYDGTGKIEKGAMKNKPFHKIKIFKGVSANDFESVQNKDTEEEVPF
jgi:hypothetical protein